MSTARENVTPYARSRLLDASEVVDRARRMLWVAESLTLSELECLDRTRAALESLVRAAMDRVFPAERGGEDLLVTVPECDR